jgi:hypothetical protein
MARFSHLNCRVYYTIHYMTMQSSVAKSADEVNEEALNISDPARS